MIFGKQFDGYKSYIVSKMFVSADYCARGTHLRLLSNVGYWFNCMGLWTKNLILQTALENDVFSSIQITGYKIYKICKNILATQFIVCMAAILDFS